MEPPPPPDLAFEADQTVAAEIRVLSCSAFTPPSPGSLFFQSFSLGAPFSHCFILRATMQMLIIASVNNLWLLIVFICEIVGGRRMGTGDLRENRKNWHMFPLELSKDVFMKRPTFLVRHILA